MPRSSGRRACRSRERGPDGTLRPAGRRDRYLVVTYVVHRPATAQPRRASTCSGFRGGDALVDRAGRTGEVAISLDPAEPPATSAGCSCSRRCTGRGELAGVVSGAFRDRVLVGAVRDALRRNVGLRVTPTPATVIGAQGTVPTDAERTRIAYGGQVFEVAVAAPHPGLRFGAARARPRRAADGARASSCRTRQRTRRRLAVGEARFADAFEASPVGQGLASPRGRLRPRQPGAVRDHGARGGRAARAHPRSTSCTRPTANGRTR